MLLLLPIALFLSPQGINSSHPSKMSERTVKKDITFNKLLLRAVSQVKLTPAF